MATDVCRFCFQTKNLLNIFDSDRIVMFGQTIDGIIRYLLSDKIEEIPDVPNKICILCHTRLSGFYEFKVKCLQENAKFEAIAHTISMKKNAERAKRQSLVQIDGCYRNPHLKTFRDVAEIPHATGGQLHASSDEEVNESTCPIIVDELRNELTALSKLDNHETTRPTNFNDTSLNESITVSISEPSDNERMSDHDTTNSIQITKISKTNCSNSSKKNANKTFNSAVNVEEVTITSQNPQQSMVADCMTVLNKKALTLCRERRNTVSLDKPTLSKRQGRLMKVIYPNVGTAKNSSEGIKRKDDAETSANEQETSKKRKPGPKSKTLKPRKLTALNNQSGNESSSSSAINRTSANKRTSCDNASDTSISNKKTKLLNKPKPKSKKTVIKSRRLTRSTSLHEEHSSKSEQETTTSNKLHSGPKTTNTTKFENTITETVHSKRPDHFNSPNLGICAISTPANHSKRELRNLRKMTPGNNVDQAAKYLFKSDAELDPFVNDGRSTIDSDFVLPDSVLSTPNDSDNGSYVGSTQEEKAYLSDVQKEDGSDSKHSSEQVNQDSDTSEDEKEIEGTDRISCEFCNRKYMNAEICERHRGVCHTRTSGEAVILLEPIHIPSKFKDQKLSSIKFNSKEKFILLQYKHCFKAILLPTTHNAANLSWNPGFLRKKTVNNDSRTSAVSVQNNTSVNDQDHSALGNDQEVPSERTTVNLTQNVIHKQSGTSRSSKNGADPDKIGATNGNN